MAHEFESGFFVGEAAWHGLGNVIQGAPTSEEGIRLAGLDWPVLERPIFATNPATPDDINSDIPCTEHKALIRGTDRKVLGVVGADFQPLQNVDAFRFFDPFLADGQATLETAGSLREGKRIFVLAKIKGSEADVIPGRDPVVGYLLLAHAHDGSMAATTTFTPIRVVCMNTLGRALRAADKGQAPVLKVRHTKNLLVGLKAVQKAVDLSRQTFSMTVDEYRAMARVGVDSKTAREYIVRVLRPVDEMLAAAEAAQLDGAQPEKQKDPRALAPILELFEGKAKGADIAGRTVWGLYNAVADWVDHERGREGTRREASWFGVGADIRTRAHKEALALV